MLISFSAMVLLAGCREHVSSPPKFDPIDLLDKFESVRIESGEQVILFNDPLVRHKYLLSGWSRKSDVDVNKFPWPVFTGKPGIVRLNWSHKLDRRIRIKLLNIGDNLSLKNLSVSLNGHVVHNLPGTSPPGIYEYFLPADIQHKGRNLLALQLNLNSFQTTEKALQIALHSITITRGAALLSHSRLDSQIRRAVLMAAPIRLRWTLPLHGNGVLDLDYGFPKPMKHIDFNNTYELHINIVSSKTNDVYAQTTISISEHGTPPDKWHHVHLPFKANGLESPVLEIEFLLSRANPTYSFYLALSEIHIRSQFRQWSLKKRIEGEDIIVLDMSGISARALSSYGNDLTRTPVIDSLSRSGKLYSDIVSISNDTVPSIPTLLSGLEPREHGVYEPGDKAKNITTCIPELLDALGYSSFAVLPENALTTPCFLSVRGFNRMFLYMPGSNSIESAYLRSLKAASNNSGPVFMWIHIPVSWGDPHRASLFEDIRLFGEKPKRIKDMPLPQSEKNKLRELFPGEDIRILKAMYHEWIHHLDHLVGVLIEKHHQSRPHRTLNVFLISTHGLIQDMDANLFSNDSLSQDILNVPVIHAKLFGNDMFPDIIRNPCSLSRLPSLIIGSLNISSDKLSEPRFQKILKRNNQAFIFSEHAQRQIVACRTANWKLVDCFSEPYYRISIFNLFNLDTDPGEHINLISRYPEQVTVLRNAIKEYCSGNPRYPTPTPGTEDEADRLLRSLGYTRAE